MPHTCPVPSSESSSQAARAERSSNAMVDAAIELIGESGLRGMTFVAIGDRSGYSRGLVTARFGSKQGLVDAVIRRVWDGLRTRRALPDSHGGSGLDDVVALVDGLADQAKNEPRELRALWVMMFEALVGDDDALLDRMRLFHHSMRSDLADALARGIDDGSVRTDLDPVAEAIQVAGTIRGLAYQWLLEPDELDLVAAFVGLAEDLRRRYRPETI